MEKLLYIQIYLIFLIITLQNLCVTAAFRPVRELLEKESEVNNLRFNIDL